MPDIECNQSFNSRLKKVIYNSETNEVFDEHENYIGQGVWKDGILQITPKGIDYDTPK